MSAELLSKAASEIRRRAEASTPGPWDADYNRFGSTIHAGAVEVASITAMNANVEHITSWNPAVALAVADWLDVVIKYGPPEQGRGTRNYATALAVARAYLGETA